ncbi:MAG: hypothetical protein ACRBBW_15135 [Cellvibrionaceae bacterium]
MQHVNTVITGMALGFISQLFGVTFSLQAILEFIGHISPLIVGVFLYLKAKDWHETSAKGAAMHWDLLSEIYDPEERQLTSKRVPEIRRLYMKKLLLGAFALAALSLFFQEIHWYLARNIAFVVVLIALMTSVQLDKRTRVSVSRVYYPATTGFRDLMEKDSTLAMHLIGMHDLTSPERDRLYQTVRSVANTPEHPDHKLAQKCLNRYQGTHDESFFVSPFIKHLTTDELCNLGNKNCEHTKLEQECQWRLEDL